MWAFEFGNNLTGKNRPPCYFIYILIYGEFGDVTKTADLLLTCIRHYFPNKNRSGVMFIQTKEDLLWLEWRIVLYLGQYHQMLHLLILKDPHIGQVISVIWKFWTLEFKFQLRKVLKEQGQTGKKTYKSTAAKNIKNVIEREPSILDVKKSKMHTKFEEYFFLEGDILFTTGFTDWIRSGSLEIFFPWATDVRICKLELETFSLSRISWLNLSLMTSYVQSLDHIYIICWDG